MDITRWLTSLAAAFGGRVKPETIRFYGEKLNRWQMKHHAADDVWSRALSRIVADCERFPSLQICYQYLSGTAQKPSEALDWMYFDQGGKRHAVRVRDWNYPPQLPHDADNVHKCPAKEYGFMPCSVDVGREAFMDAYEQAGGDSGKIRLYLGALGMAAPKEYADYDDSPEAA